MKITPIPIHGYLVRHGPGSRVRATVNGFPLYGGVTESQDSVSGVLNHLMVPGKNVLRAEVLHGDRGVPAAHFMVDARGSDTYPQVALSWLDGKGALPEPGVFDWVGEAVFESEPGVPEPMWTSAPPEPVPDDGTDELWGEIRALVKSFEGADAAGVIEMFALKASDMHAMMLTKWSPPATVEKMMRDTVDRPWAVEPMEPEAVYFRSFQGDRLVHVGRLDATPVLCAQRVGGDQPVKVRTDLVFMRHQGRWRIIR